MPGTPMDSNIHSPMDDVTKGFNQGGKSDPAPPSIHSPCDFNMGASGKADGSTFGDADARTPVSLEEVQFATGIPEADTSGSSLFNTPSSQVP